MKITNQKLWDKGFANNTDPYGARIYSYAKDWAELMEVELASGRTLAEVAKETSCKADTDGITNFMHDAAVSVLAAVWEHGEELRKLLNVGK